MLERQMIIGGVTVLSLHSLGILVRSGVVSDAYPFEQIALLFAAVFVLAILAEDAITKGRRWTCEVMLALGCVLCVASMAWTVHRYVWTHRNDSPIPSVRLSDLSHAHTYCGPGCRAMEVGR